MFEYAKDQFERQVADSQRGITYISLVEGRRVAAESLLATSEAFLAVSEALLAAAEGGDETALQVAVEAYNAISDAYAAALKAFSDILEIEDCVVPELCQVGFNFAPSAGELHLAWSRLLPPNAQRRLWTS